MNVFKYLGHMGRGRMRDYEFQPLLNARDDLGPSHQPHLLWCTTVFALTTLFWSRLWVFLLAENELQLRTGMRPCIAMSREPEEGEEGVLGRKRGPEGLRTWMPFWVGSGLHCGVGVPWTGESLRTFQREIIYFFMNYVQEQWRWPMGNSLSLPYVLSNNSTLAQTCILFLH